MNVNIFVARIDGSLKTDLLVLPLAPGAAVPPRYRSGWSYFATVDTQDQIFGDVDAIAIETEIAHSGYAVVGTQVEDRR